MLRYTRLTTYGGLPATEPGPLPPPRVTWPDRRTWPNPNWAQQGGKVYLPLHYQSGSTFCQTFCRHDLGQVIFRKLNDLIARRAWFGAFGRRPTPFYKFPPMVCDRHLIRSLVRLALQDGHKDLLITGEVVIRNVACQNLVIVRPNHNESVYTGHIPAAQCFQMNTRPFP